MGATTRLALLGVRRRSRGQVIALALVTALAAVAIVTGLAAQRSATDLVDRAYQRAGRPDLVLVGDADALRRAADDPAVAAASDPAPVAALEIDGDGEPVADRRVPRGGGRAVGGGWDGHDRRPHPGLRTRRDR